MPRGSSRTASERNEAADCESLGALLGVVIGLILDREHALDLRADVAEPSTQELGPLVKRGDADWDVDRTTAVVVASDANREVPGLGRVCQVSSSVERDAPRTKSESSVLAAHRDCSACSG